MFDHRSRYYTLQVAAMRLPNGRIVSYVQRRILPRADSLTPLADVPVAPNDRIDLVANRTLGDPLTYWRICDANLAMDPRELTEQPGRLLRIPMPRE